MRLSWVWISLAFSGISWIKQVLRELAAKVALNRVLPYVYLISYCMILRLCDCATVRLCDCVTVRLCDCILDAHPSWHLSQAWGPSLERKMSRLIWPIISSPVLVPTARLLLSRLVTFVAEAASAAQQQLQQQQPEQGRLSSIFISGVVTEQGNRRRCPWKT